MNLGVCTQIDLFLSHGSTDDAEFVVINLYLSCQGKSDGYMYVNVKASLIVICTGYVNVRVSLMVICMLMSGQV